MDQQKRMNCHTFAKMANKKLNICFQEQMHKASIANGTQMLHFFFATKN